MTSARNERTASGLAFSVAGSGPPLLLVHGLMARGAMFEPLVALLERDFTLLVPDLRGSGASAEMPGPYAIERLATDLVEVLDQLQLPTASLLGYSHGGPVCQQLARQSPERVDRLILACSYAYNAATAREYLESWVFSGLLALLGPRRTAALLVRENASVGGGPPLPAEQVRWLRSVLGEGNRAALASAARGLRQFDSRLWLRNLTLRALVVAGADDHAVPPHHFSQLTSQLRQCESRVIEGAGHSLVWTHTTELAQIVRDWLPRG